MKVEIRLRADNERGLFAIDNIKKNEFICILPIDYIQLDNKWYVFNGRFLNTKIDFRYGILCEIEQNGVNEYETIRNLALSKKSLNSNKLEIIGVSNDKETEENFIGHMINDYVDMSFLSENKYEKMSKEFSNVKVLPKLELFSLPLHPVYHSRGRLGLRIIATKDIVKGKELYLSYGSEYWKKYSRKEKKYIFQIELLVVN